MSRIKHNCSKMGILLRLLGKESARDPRGQAGIWTGITGLLAEVNAAWNNHDGGPISQAETAKQMQLLSAEPGLFLEGAGFFIGYCLTQLKVMLFYILSE